MEERKRTEKRVLWWGAAEAEYGWLKNRVANYFSLSTPLVRLLTVDDPIEQLGKYCENGQVDRVIVACLNRWDYPGLQLQQLAIQFPEIPVALAVGDWWMGWRRTGIGHLQNLPHLSLPWYRWLDGWVQWLEGEIPTMFGPFPLERNSITFTANRLSNNCGDQQKDIVWHDSQLATWLGWPESLDLAIEDLIEIQASHPLAKLWIAWTLPTWELVSRLNHAGLSYELIAKPHLLSLSSAALART